MGETCLPKRTDPNAFRHISHGSAMSHHQLCHFHTHVQVYTHPQGAGQTWICHPAVSAGSQLWHSRGSRHSLRPHKSLTVKPAPGSKAGFSLASRQKSCRKEGTWFLHFRLQRIVRHQMKVVSSCQISRLHGKKQNQTQLPPPSPSQASGTLKSSLIKMASRFSNMPESLQRNNAFLYVT